MPDRRRETGTVRALLPALALMVGTTAGIGAMLFQAPTEARQYAVLFAPGTPLIEVLDSLAVEDARLVRTGLWDNLVVADFGAQRDKEDIHLPGAWLWLDPVRLGGCFTDTPVTQRTLVAAPRSGNESSRPISRTESAGGGLAGNSAYSQRGASS